MVRGIPTPPTAQTPRKTHARWLRNDFRTEEPKPAEDTAQNRQNMPKKIGQRRRGCRQDADTVRTVSRYQPETMPEQLRPAGSAAAMVPEEIKHRQPPEPQKGSGGAALSLSDRPILPVFVRTPLFHSPTNKAADRSSSCTPTGFLFFCDFDFLRFSNFVALCTAFPELFLRIAHNSTYALFAVSRFLRSYVLSEFRVFFVALYTAINSGFLPIITFCKTSFPHFLTGIFQLSVF